MNSQIKQLVIFLWITVLLFLPMSSFADCRPVHVDQPKMMWYLDECGNWHQDYDRKFEEYYYSHLNLTVNPDSIEAYTWNGHQ